MNKSDRLKTYFPDRDWTRWPGGNWVYWVDIAKIVSEFVQSHSLKHVAAGPVLTGATPAAAKTLTDLGIRGGIRVPHLHLDDKIYLLDNEQWAKFSAGIIADVKAKLAKVKEVSFEEGLLLGGVAQTLLGD